MPRKISLTPVQQEIIGLIPRDNVQIIACAGSGKTEVVSRGAGEIIKRGISPANVVAFTFTEKAANELKARIREILIEDMPESSDVSEMYVGTIHSYCFEILKELLPSYKSYDVLDEAKRVAFLSKPYNYYNRMKLVRLEDRGVTKKLTRYSVINRFISSVDIILDENIPVESLDAELRDSVQAYFDLLEEEKYLDFPTMISRLVSMLEKDGKLRKRLQHSIRNLIVDEYQDINGLQERLIQAMTGPDTRVCVVGDDDQCIYNWRGSVVDYIINFKKNFHGAKQKPLEYNFRSTKAVIKLAGSLISKNRRRLDFKEMKPAEGKKTVSHEGDIQYSHFDDEEEQVAFIVSRARELKGTDFIGRRGGNYSLSLGDMAILVRSNTDLTRLLHLLNEAGLKYVVDSGRYIFEMDIVGLAMNAIDYVFDIDHHTSAMLAEQYRTTFSSHGYPLSCLDGFSGGLRRLRSEMRAVAGNGNKDYLPELGLQGMYHGILSCMGLNKVDLEEADHFYLATLSQAISDYESVWRRLRHSEIKYFRGFVTAWGQSHYRESMSSEALNVDAVKIMTIHKAKGLEFPVVFLPYLNRKQKRRRPLSFVDEELFDADRYHGDEEDERRVYYVALTRSEKYLFLSGMRNDPEVVKPRLPLEFIPELDRHLLSGPQKLKREKSGYPPRQSRDDSLSTTFSDLSSYGRCPNDFKLRHYFGYNAGVPSAFGYGTRIHDILNVIHKEYRDTPPSSTEIEDLVEGHFFLRYAPGDITKNMKKAAKQVIKNYVKGHSADFRNILETEKKFEIMFGDDSVAGQIDLIKKLDGNGNLKEIEVVDFKSDSSLLYKVDYEHQLRLYVMACISALKLQPAKACIHDLEHGEKRYIDINEDKLQETSQELRARIMKVKNRDFPPHRTEKICGACDYCRICRYS